MGGWFFKKRMRLGNTLKRLTACKDRRVPVVLINIGLLSILFVSCKKPEPESPTSQVTDTLIVTPNESCLVRIEGKVGKSNVKDAGKLKSSSGFFVNRKGDILIPAHEIKELEQISITPYGSDTSFGVDAIPFHVSQNFDVAVGKTESSFSTFYDPHRVIFTDDTSPIDIGINIEIPIWCNKSKIVWISGQIDLIWGQDSLLIKIIGGDSAWVKEGCSGSPIFIQGTNLVIGSLSSEVATTYREPNYTYTPLPKYRAVYVKRIKDLLEEKEVFFLQRHYEGQPWWPYVPTSRYR